MKEYYSFLTRKCLFGHKNAGMFMYVCVRADFKSAVVASMSENISLW